MTIAVSTAPALPVPVLPGQQGNAAGDMFALLMGGAPQGETLADATVQTGADMVATPAASAEDPANPVKAATALVSSLMPAKEAEGDTAAKPVAAQPIQIATPRTEGRTRETAAPEKKEGRGKAKTAGEEAPKTQEARETALPAILIALPAAGDVPEAAPAPTTGPEAAEIEVTATPARADRAAPLPRPAKDLPAIFEVDGAKVAATATNTAPVSTGPESIPAAGLQALPIKAAVPAGDVPVDASVPTEAASAQAAGVPAPAEPVEAETAVAVELPSAPKTGKPAPAASAAKAGDVQKPAPGAEKPAVAIDTILAPTPVHAARVAPVDIPAIQPAIQVATGPSAPVDIVADRQLDLVRNEQWLGELARDIADSSGDNQKLNFKLMPPQLGRLDVDLSRSHHGLSLTIRTETDSAQAILTAAQPRLVEEMRAQGVKLADTQMFSGDMRQSSNQGGQAQPAPTLIEAFVPQAESEEAAHETVRDGRYA